MPQPVKMFTPVGLQRLLTFWQKKLRLADWRPVTIRYVSKKEMGDDSQGRCVWDLNAKTAAILILHPDDYNPADYPNEEPQDIEDTVVHELLHLHTAPWDVDGNAVAEQLQEQAIQSIAGALVALKRRTK